MKATPLRTLLVLAWPVVLARASQGVVGLCDAFMSAPLGEDALAAVTTGSLNAYTLAILPQGVVFIVQSFASQLSGRGEHAGTLRFATYGLVLSAIATLMAVASIPLLGDILGWLDYSPGVRTHIHDYLALRLWGIGPFVAMEALGNWYGGLGNTRPHMRASLLTMAANVGLNWVLIDGNLGAPAMGVRGAALASALAATAGFTYLAVRFALDRRKTTGDRGVHSFDEFFRVVRFGLPNGINWFLELGAFAFFLNVIVAKLGTVPLAAMMVIFNLNSVSFMPAFGLATAGSILAGQAIGAGRHHDVRGIVWLTIRVAAVWQGAIGALYFGIPELIMRPFASEDVDTSQLLELGAAMLVVSAAWQLFDSVALTLAEALRAAGDTTWAMWVRIGIAWAFFTPLAYLLTLVWELGPVAAMWAVVAYVAALAAALTYRFQSGAWRSIELVGYGPEDGERAQPPAAP